jgi:hypothetical protein
LVLSCFALVLVFVVLHDSDDAADNDGFLDETHCDCEEVLRWTLIVGRWFGRLLGRLRFDAVLW